MGTTPNYGWTYPTVNADADTWGTKLNTMAIAIDASLKTVDNGLSARLAAASNLSDLANAGTARTNLGLGQAAVKSVSDNSKSVVASVLSSALGHLAYFSDNNGTIGDSGYATGNIMQINQNLSDVASPSTARANLGLGTISTHNVTISSSAPSGGSDGDIWLQYA